MEERLVDHHDSRIGISTQAAAALLYNDPVEQLTCPLRLLTSHLDGINILQGQHNAIDLIVHRSIGENVKGVPAGTACPAHPAVPAATCAKPEQ